MAGSFSDYTEDKVLDHILKVSSFVVPANVYCALYTVAPSDSGGGTEVSGGSYARKLTNGLWVISSGGVTSNNAKITFVTATAAWGTVVAFALFDAITVGNMLLWADLTENKIVGDGDTIEFIIGALDITLT